MLEAYLQDLRATLANTIEMRDKAQRINLADIAQEEYIRRDAQAVTLQQLIEHGEKQLAEALKATNGEAPPLELAEISHIQDPQHTS